MLTISFHCFFTKFPSDKWLEKRVSTALVLVFQYLHNKFYIKYLLYTYNN